jgi:hypothetical protein
VVDTAMWLSTRIMSVHACNLHVTSTREVQSVGCSAWELVHCAALSAHQHARETVQQQCTRFSHSHKSLAHLTTGILLLFCVPSAV